MTVEELKERAKQAKAAGDTREYLRILLSLSGWNVLLSWAENCEGKLKDEVVAEIQRLQPDSSLEEFPAVTSRILELMCERLPAEEVRSLLARNHHRVPEKAFSDHPGILAESGIDALLAHRHKKLLAELRRHAESGEIWYEQVITDEVVDYVERNPEIQAGVRHGDSIFVTKFPFAPAELLRETDPLKRRYLYCHCPLARESILTGETVSALACNCSAGFTKLPFDVAFGQPTVAHVVSSVLAGDDFCRFRIEIPASALPPGRS